MKQLMEQYTAYNYWANEQLIRRIVTLPEKAIQQTVVSSFSSLFLTLLHMWNTESTWWQRMKLSETVEPPGSEQNSLKEITEGLLVQSKQWEEWVAKSTLAALEHVFAYKNSKKEQFKQPVFQMIFHVCNHATYHRGQLVTILRQLEAESIPATDFIIWCRNKKSVS